MLKMYQTMEAPGWSQEYWHHNWSAVAFDEALAFCKLDPLRSFLDQYFLPGKRILEGGCGLGQYIAYYREAQAKLVGLDMVLEPLQEIKKRFPDTDVNLGNVEQLPFRSEAFDVYYSGGVVEHFEEGPVGALMEAKRVLRRDGVFLVSVPDESLLRRMIMGGNKIRMSQRGCWKRVSAPERPERPTREDEECPAGLMFFQYAFSQREFRSYLERAGFRILKTFGYSIQWGLAEVGFARRLFSRMGRSGTCKPHSSSQLGRGAQQSRNGTGWNTWIREVGRRFLIMEDQSMIPFAPLLWFLKATSANMRMYVCVRP